MGSSRASARCRAPDTTDEARHALAAGAMRLTDADGMGGAYKAFALASADVGAARVCARRVKF